MTEKDNGFTVRYTNKDIIQRIEALDTTAQEILAHAKVTNGRVNTLEDRSIGFWAANHPFKFAIIILMLLSFLISDIRHPLMDLLLSFF